MKIKGRITALVMVLLMLVAQVPFAAFAAETDTTDTTDTSDINAEYLSPDTLVNGKVDWNYSMQFSFDWKSANTGYQSYFWDIIDGALPPGLTLYPNGVTANPWIEGIPTKAGTYTFTVQGAYRKLNNDLVIDAQKTYTLTILPNPLEISTDVLLNGKEGTSYSSKAGEYNERTVTWSMELADGEALPDGLSIDSESGEINWKSPVAGKYNLKITATRGEESTSKVLKLIIEPEGGCRHTDKEHTERKHATCKENGMADYWYCDTCEKYFLNEKCTRETEPDGLDKRYTIGFHSDENDDGKCDTCEKTMPVFTRVTDEDEITSGGMYLVASKIDDKYYALKAPEKTSNHCIEATEITQNADGTFSYPQSGSEVMILKTEFAAECGELDAGLPRYSIGTTIDGIPYSVSSEDYSGSIQMYSYENNKYGYRMSLPANGTPAIASVYAEYWSGDDYGDSGILTAFQGTKDGENERFFSFRTKAAYESDGYYTGYGYEKYDEASLSTFPIELYKLTYTGTVNGQNYTLSDTQCTVEIGSRVTVVDSADGKSCSTVGGIGEAVKTSYVESVISGQTEITGDVSAKTYAEIKLTSEESSTDEWGYSSISSLKYTITPKLEIKDVDSEKSTICGIDDEYFDGSEMTVSLCVGNMEPRQIIHHKADGTKEYFYEEHSAQAKKGAKSFVNDPHYNGKGNFVTFTIDSFSDIEILAEAKAAETNTVANGNKFTVTGVSVDAYTVVLALYKEEQGTRKLADCRTAVYNGAPISFATADNCDYTSAKVMVWKDLADMEPVTEVEIVALEESD